MSKNVLKNVIRSFVITIVFGGALYAVAAFILYKSSVPLENYKYFSFVIMLLVSVIIAVSTYKHGEKSNAVLSALYELPPVLFVTITAFAVPDGLSLKALILIILLMAVGIIIPSLASKRNKPKKRNMNKIRRDYERLRKR